MSSSRDAERSLDAYLLAEIRLGDRGALDMLVRRWTPKMTAHAWRLLGEREPARDAVQESWTQALRGLARLKEDRAFAVWILRIVTRQCAAHIKLRQRAMDKGWLLNEYALEEAETGKVVASETEEAIYEALGLPWIPEVLREDDGEIEAAEKGHLPRAITLDELRGDLHVHTDLSGDGRSPLVDMVAAAKARGYRFLAITEHAEDIPLQGVKRDALLDQRQKVQALQKELGDELTLLHGVELNIGPEGGLDYDHEFRMLFDWCLASVHTHFDLTKEQQTKRIVAAMTDPSVNMIGHLTARAIGKRPPIELDMPTILDTAEQTRTGLEINSGLPRLDLSTSILRQARERDVVFVMTSDAHHVSELDRMQWGVKQALRGWVDPDKVANVWSRERFLDWTKERRGRA